MALQPVSQSSGARRRYERAQTHNAKPPLTLPQFDERDLTAHYRQNYTANALPYATQQLTVSQDLREGLVREIQVEYCVAHRHRRAILADETVEDHAGDSHAARFLRPRITWLLGSLFLALFEACIQP